MMKRMTMGMSQPAGRSRSFSENGRSFWTESQQVCVEYYAATCDSHQRLRREILLGESKE
jgi:hypothetical protein